MDMLSLKAIFLPVRRVSLGLGWVMVVCLRQYLFSWKGTCAGRPGDSKHSAGSPLALSTFSVVWPHPEASEGRCIRAVD